MQLTFAIICCASVCCTSLKFAYLQTASYLECSSEEIRVSQNVGPERPAARLPEKPTHCNPLSFCTCGTSCQLRYHKSIPATCFDLIGKSEVLVQTKRCNRRDCGMVYGPSFRIRQAELINTTKISEMALDAILFNNTKIRFTIRFLKYHANLLFRYFASGRGVEFAFGKTFFDASGDDAKPLRSKFRTMYYDALFYYMVGWNGKH